MYFLIEYDMCYSFAQCHAAQPGGANQQGPMTHLCLAKVGRLPCSGFQCHVYFWLRHRELAIDIHNCATSLATDFNSAALIDLSCLSDRLLPCSGDLQVRGVEM